MPLDRLVSLAQKTMGRNEWENNDMLAPKLDPADVPDGVWVSHDARGEYTADGNHRIAGMSKWCEANNVDLATVEIDVWVSVGDPPNLEAPRAKEVGYSPHWWASPKKTTPKKAPSPRLDPANIKTRAVAGAAYKTSDIRSTLTHAVDQTTDEPLCHRVKPENILDDPYAVDDEDAPATCPICAKRDPRFN